jgi:hypothetical protein
MIRFIMHIHRGLILFYTPAMNTLELSVWRFIVLEYHGYLTRKRGASFNFLARPAGSRQGSRQKPQGGQKAAGSRQKAEGRRAGGRRQKARRPEGQKASP